MNSITRKQYEEIKNKNTYSVVSFRNGKRTMTYSGLNILDAIKSIQEYQKHNDDVLLIENLPSVEISRDRKDYEKYIRGERE
jgi:hypothetical protein